MNPLIQSKNATILPILIAITLGCFGLLPQARAVDPPPGGGYPNQNTAEGDDALFSLTTGADNTVMGFDALDSNTTRSDNALASWIWRATGSLNTARLYHTATLLQNGMVLVAGGLDSSALLPRAPNCTTRRAVPGLPQAASTPHAIFTRRRCYKTAWSLLQGDRTALAIFPRALNCTTRQAGPGLPQAASTPHMSITRRRCYKTAWSLLPGDMTALAIFPRAPNYTTRQAGPGGARAASRPHAVITRRRCYKTAWSLLPGELTNCQRFREHGTVRPSERDLDCHRQPQHRTQWPHGDVATKRHGHCCRGI